jgi:putative Holliday junction resolvase
VSGGDAVTGAMGRVIGVDHGLQRVGVAVGDEETGMAFPRSVLKTAAAADGVRLLAEDEGTRRVVVGLPLNADGSEGRQAALARAFGSELAGLGLDVTFTDERLTTWAAEQAARTADRPKPTNAIDSAAAALILEQYFADRRRRPEES